MYYPIYKQAYDVYGAGGNTPAVPAPTNLRTTGTTSSTISLVWDAAAGTYTLERAPVTNGAPGTFAGIYTGTTASYTDGALTFNTAYAYRVKVTVNGVASGYSAVLQATTPAGQPWMNAEVATILPTQSNGSGYSPISGLTTSDKATNSRVGIWNKATQQVEVYQPIVNDQGIPVGVTPNYERGFGPDLGYRQAWLEDSANAGKTLIFFKPYITPPPGTDTNGASIAYWNSTLLQENLADYANFKAWMVSNGYPAPVAYTTDADIGEQDSYLNNTNYESDLVALLDQFVSAGIFNANTKYVLPLLQRNPDPYHDALINQGKTHLATVRPNTQTLSISSPGFFDGTHFAAESQKRRGREWYRLTHASLAPIVSSYSPQRIIQGQQVTVTGYNFIAGTTVTLGGLAVTNLALQSTTSLNFTAPASSTPAALVVSNGQGSTTISGIEVVPASALAKAGERWAGKQYWTNGNNWLLSEPEPLGLNNYVYYNTAFNAQNLCPVFLSKPQVLKFYAPKNTGLSTGDLYLIREDGSILTLGSFSEIGPQQATDPNVPLFTSAQIPAGRYTLVLVNNRQDGSFLLLDTCEFADQ